MKHVNLLVDEMFDDYPPEWLAVPASPS
jgi:hypothetical protein